MPRRNREDCSGNVYHTIGQVLHSARHLGDPAIAGRLKEVVHEAKDRDKMVIYAWCILPDAYHLVLRINGQPLWRSMAFIHREFARWFNGRRRKRGPFWHGRYLACNIRRMEEFRQLIPYVHLRPVVVGRVEDPSQYPWSGHRELVHRVERPLADPERALSVYGRTRDDAIADYLRVVSGGGIPWSGNDVRRLPWWRRPPTASSGESSAEGQRSAKALSVRSADEFVAWACALLALKAPEVRSRRKDARLTTARETLLLVGTTTMRLGVGELSRSLGLNPSSASRILRRASLRCTEDHQASLLVSRLRHLLGGEPGGDQGGGYPPVTSNSQTWYLSDEREYFQLHGEEVQQSIVPPRGRVRNVGRKEAGAMLTRQDVFIDPTPTSPRTLSPEEMSHHVGGGLPAVIIITCGAGLGKYTVVVAGTVVITVIDQVE